jgi:hypothetical protein
MKGEYDALAEGDIMHKWLDMVFNPKGYGAESREAQSRELLAQLSALHAYKPELLRSRFPEASKLMEQIHADVGLPDQGQPAAAGGNKAGGSGLKGGEAAGGGKGEAKRDGATAKAQSPEDLKVANLYATREKPVDEPVKAAPQNILEGAIKRHTEYLENPPDDYTPAEAQKRGQWAEKQLARVQVELDKIKGSDDYDRQDQLSDYKFALKRLVAKAKEIVEADAHLEKELGPQSGEAKYNAQSAEAPKGAELPDLAIRMLLRCRASLLRPGALDKNSEHLLAPHKEAWAPALRRRSLRRKTAKDGAEASAGSEHFNAGIRGISEPCN